METNHYRSTAVRKRSLRTLEGHAVRAVFFATGVTDLAIETGDADYRLAASWFWDSTTLRRMAITGSVGPRQRHEALGEDYELPNNGYYESCAACGLVDFARRMFLLERRAESADVLERVLYNAVLHGIGLSGTNSYYQNPLSDRDKPRYNSWVCCPPNLSRTLLQVGRYAYAHTDREVYVNLYVGSTAQVPLAPGPVRLQVETDYPWDGAVKLTVRPEKTLRFTLCLRRPGWCARTTLKVKGEQREPAALLEAGYPKPTQPLKPPYQSPPLGWRYSSSVDKSPSGKPCALAFNTRRMILPDRVLGNLSTNFTSSGLAIGPISWPTCLRRSSASSSDPV